MGIGMIGCVCTIIDFYRDLEDTRKMLDVKKTI